MNTVQLLLVWVAAASVEAASAPVATANEPLLQTRWYQDGPFARFTPGQERVGCWSTAYAQILFFHRLAPTGRVRYQCSSGHEVDVDLGAYHFDWTRFPKVITAATPTESLEQVARYSFATAVAVRKDFGTGGYRRLLNSVADLETHFPVSARIYVHLAERLPVARTEVMAKLRTESVTNLVDRIQIVSLLRGELAERRPVYFHFGNIKDFGHSTVIDGIENDGQNPKVHINFGAVEPERNKWYELFSPISQADDVTLRAFVTILPRLMSTRAQGDPPPH